MKFSIKDFFSKYEQIRSFLQIWSHLLERSIMENFIFCTVITAYYLKKKKRNRKCFMISNIVTGLTKYLQTGGKGFDLIVIFSKNIFQLKRK